MEGGDTIMNVSVIEAQNNLETIVQDLVDGKEKVVYVYKDGKPLLKITPVDCVSNINSKRIGAAKKEMEGFDISLEEFNSIPTYFN